MKNLMMFLVLIMASSVGAEETSIAKEPEQVDETVQQAPQPEEAKQDDIVPDADALRERKLSDAFEQFIPSETISADNAVPFPTDI